MSRTVSPEFQSEIRKIVLRPVLMFSGDFSGNTLHLWSGFGQLQWNSIEWTGIGGFGSISPLHETTEVQASGVDFTLSGIPLSMLRLALADSEKGDLVKLWIGLLDERYKLIGDPVQIYTGQIDVPQIDEGSETCTITLNTENQLIELERSRERRYTHEDQKIEFPEDRGLEYIASLQDKKISWGG